MRSLLFHGRVRGHSLHRHHLTLEIRGHANRPIQRLSERQEGNGIDTESRQEVVVVVVDDTVCSYHN